MLIIRNRAQAVLYEYAKQFLERGKTILIPCNTCESIPLAYQKIGIPFEMIDINETSMSMDLEEVERKIKQTPKQYQAIHYVYNYGIFNSEEQEKLLKLKHFYGIKVIEDKCLCMPEFSFNDARKIESDIELYSTGHCKCVDVGKGGYAYINEDYASEWCFCEVTFDIGALRQLKEGFKRKEVNWQYLSSLDWLENFLIKEEEVYIDAVKKKYMYIAEKKKRMNDIYRSIIPDKLCMPEKCHAWRFQVLLANAEEVIERIFHTEGLFASHHYRAWGRGIFSNEYFPKAKCLEEHVVNLFNDEYYDEEKAVNTAEIIRKYGEVYE